MSAPSPVNTKPRLPAHKYTVGWISALPIEQAAAAELLDEEHEPPGWQDNDSTIYTLGMIAGHYVVIASLPAGFTGLASGANVARSLADRFPNARVGLMVGIGGGVPSIDTDIRLGDVVISQPGNGNGGVVQYDMGKRLPNGKFQDTSHLNAPPLFLLGALSTLRANHLRGRSRFATYLRVLEETPNGIFRRENAGLDQLYQPDSQHVPGPDCMRCNDETLIMRESRAPANTVQFHYGTIASANLVMRDGVERDRVCQELGGNILCFEMEAAGLMNSFPCLVIRGICDYADAHKNKKWQPYAAATAAAYAKELLSVISPKDLTDINPIKAPWVLPFTRNPRFTGRSDIVTALHVALSDPELHSSVAIHGLGGSGKSAVAVEFAYQARNADQSCAVFWVSSFTVERFQESIREIALHLQIPGADDLKNDMLEPVRRELCREGWGKWLMIVDNIDNKEVLFTPVDGDQRLYDFLPISRSGMTLFTTRNRKIANDVAPTHHFFLDHMDLGEAEILVQRSLSLQYQHLYSQDLVNKFLSVLAFLPLAIIQAMAYMKSNDLSMKQYMELLQKTPRNKIELLQRNFQDPTRDVASQNAIIATWLLSFEQIRKDDWLAARYLCFLACIAPQNIPRTIFPAAQSDVRQQDAIGTLTAYSFLTKRAGTDTYDVHVLLHDVIQKWLKESKRWPRTVLKSVNFLCEIIPPGGHEMMNQYVLYLSHGRFATNIPEIMNKRATIHLLDNVGRCYHDLGEYNNAILVHQEVLRRRKWTIGIYQKATLISMNELGCSLASHNHLKEAEDIHEQALKLGRKVLGDNHRETLTSMANLASTFRSQGRLDEAEKLETEVLEASKIKLGADHPDTIISMDNLASTFWSQGRLDEAEKLETEVLEACKIKLSADHPDTIISMANLANTFRSQGRLDEAEKLQTEVLEARKTKIGANHPDTLNIMANLAHTFRSQGRLDEAEKLQIEVLQARKIKLNANHPDTLNTMANLAYTFREQGRLDEAEKLETEVLEARKIKLGVNHPDTLNTMANLAYTFWSQGRLDEAEKLETEVLEARKIKLSADHPDTLTIMANLACTFREQGRLDEAEKLQIEVLEARKMKLGVNHPDTLNTMADLAYTFWSQGRLDEAEKLQTEVLEARKIKLSADHPDTLTIMANLAYTFREQGRLDEAEKLQIEVLEARKMKLGVNHPDTLNTMADLAYTFWSQDRLDEAEKLETEVLEARKIKLSADHPDTLTIMADLAYTFREQGRLDEAEKLQIEVLETRKIKLSADHPDTLTIMADLAFTLKENSSEEAITLMTDCVERSSKVLGSQNHLTIERCSILRAWQKSTVTGLDLEPAIGAEVQRDPSLVNVEEIPTNLSIPEYGKAQTHDFGSNFNEEPLPKKSLRQYIKGNIKAMITRRVRK